MKLAFVLDHIFKCVCITWFSFLSIHIVGTTRHNLDCNLGYAIGLLSVNNNMYDKRITVLNFILIKSLKPKFLKKMKNIGDCVASVGPTTCGLSCQRKRQIGQTIT